MSKSVRNPYREHIQLIWRHFNASDVGLKKVLLVERLIIIILCCILILMPSMLVRYCFGRSGRITRKIAVEVYVVLKTALAVAVLFLGLWHQRWFAWVSIVMLVDLFSFIIGLILLRGFWRSPISLNRTIILLGFNFLEYTAWFAGLYLCFGSLRAGYEIITDPVAALYFSVVTVATVGYGDITPSGLGRTLATLQIVASLLFMAAVVAYFIGGLERQKPDEEPPNA